MQYKRRISPFLGLVLPGLILIPGTAVLAGTRLTTPTATFFDDLVTFDSTHWH